jgi:hypothetical protein
MLSSMEALARAAHLSKRSSQYLPWLMTKARFEAQKIFLTLPTLLDQKTIERLWYQSWTYCHPYRCTQFATRFFPGMQQGSTTSRALADAIFFVM